VELGYPSESRLEMIAAQMMESVETAATNRAY
jgi:hypothetical protein